MKPRPTSAALAMLWCAAASTAPAQDLPSADTTKHAKRGSQFLIPTGSLLVPGLGQYLYGAPATGAAFTGSAAAGYALYFTGDTAAVTAGGLPRHPAGQQAFAGLLLVAGAGELSAYDAFRRAVPALQREGKYRFLGRPEPTGTLLRAPFDPHFLTRWTTWVELAYTAAVTALVLSDREPGITYEPYKARDAAFVTGVSLSAGAGEEAMFRGWIFPLLHQALGERFALSNGIQAAIFGALHVPDAKGFAAVIAGWALYEGWLTRRNGWSIRESVFHHFWYDVLVASATFLTDERTTVAVAFPPLRF